MATIARRKRGVMDAFSLKDSAGHHSATTTEPHVGALASGVENAACDTIVAVSTAAGPGAIGIVRLSGPAAMTVCDAVFQPKSRRLAHVRDSHRMYRGWAVAPDGERIDDVLCVTMRAPASYTGEHSAEVHAHGGRAILDAIVAACLRAGARLAQPGEFTQRAFLNNRLDLTQAEAVAGLIAASTEKQRRLALRQFDGALSERLREAQARLVDATAELEAYIDFPEEDLPEVGMARILAGVDAVAADLARLVKTFERGRMTAQGARVVLIGAPNAGKSSLMNAMLGRERAIVSPHAGTTRDTIEATVDLAGFSVTLIDTAGIRDTADDVELLGVERTREAIATADFAVVVVDASQLTDANFTALIDLCPRLIGTMPAVVAVNKSDLLPNSADAASALADLLQRPSIVISASAGMGLADLEHHLTQFLLSNDSVGDVALTTLRQADLISKCLAYIEEGRDRLVKGESFEFIAQEFHDALHALGEVRGVDIADAVMDQVFRKFCLGK